jgi:hypothetical protein
MLPVTRQGSGKPCSFEGRDELAFLVWRGRGDAPGSRDTSENASRARGKTIIVLMYIDLQ